MAKDDPVSQWNTRHAESAVEREKIGNNGLDGKKTRAFMPGPQRRINGHVADGQDPTLLKRNETRHERGLVGRFWT